MSLTLYVPTRILRVSARARAVRETEMGIDQCTSGLTLDSDRTTHLIGRIVDHSACCSKTRRRRKDDREKSGKNGFGWLSSFVAVSGVVEGAAGSLWTVKFSIATARRETISRSADTVHASQRTHADSGTTACLPSPPPPAHAIACLPASQPASHPAKEIER